MLGYVSASKGHLAWLAWLKGDLSCTKREALEALETAKDYPMLWSVLLPLMAVECQQGEYAGAITRASAMLDPKQQRLPEALHEALEQAVNLREGKPELLREALARVVEAAKEACLL